MWKKHFLIIDFYGNTKEVNLNTRIVAELFKTDDLKEEVKEHKNKEELLNTISNFADKNIKYGVQN